MLSIYSWNINGMRSALQNGFLKWFRATNPDVLSLQEIRAEWDELPANAQKALTAEHEVCWFPCSVKKGYAGSATLVRKGLGIKQERGIGVSSIDDEGRLVVSRHEGFVLLAGYFPNASTGLVRLEYKRSFAAEVTRVVKECHEKKERVIVLGDLNVAPEEIDLARPGPNRGAPGFTDEEREDFRTYLSAGLCDVVRERNPDVKGLYTFWSRRGNARKNNVGWRLDHILLSKALLPSVHDAVLHTKVKGSDHCPISVVLKL